jgi:CheY-like chemotaxis protein
MSEEPLRVLFADDDEASRVLLRVLLEFVDGVEIVGEARDGLEAVELAQETRPQLVILDVRMPRLDGLAAAEVLLAANPGIELVVHTSEPDSERLRQAERLGIRISDKADPEGLVRQVEAAAADAAETPSAQNRIHTAVLAALFGSAPGQALLVSTPADEIVFYNQAAADFLHWPFPPQPKRLSDAYDGPRVVAPRGRWHDLHERRVGRALSTRRPTSEQVMTIERDGALVQIAVRAAPLFDANGELIGVASYFNTPEDDLDVALRQTLSRRLPRQQADGGTTDGDGSGPTAEVADDEGRSAASRRQPERRSTHGRSC